MRISERDLMTAKTYTLKKRKQYPQLILLIGNTTIKLNTKSLNNVI